MHFSDLLMPNDFPDFPNRHQVLAYLHDYAKKFDLQGYVQFNTTVTLVEKIGSKQDDSSVLSSPKWKVSYEQNSESKEELFDAVIVATGFNSKPFYPPEVEELKKVYTRGKIIHSIDYRTSEIFEGNKTVLVMGLCASGIDIASIAAHKSNSVYFSVTDSMYAF